MAGILRSTVVHKMAEAILPHMDDPDMWEDSVPECVHGHHDWHVMEDHELVIACVKCDLALVVIIS